MEFDRRRRQYVPLAVTFAHSDTGVKLKRKFGRDGILIWVCYLAACKSNWIQGQLTYTSEPDGWTKLGLYGVEPPDVSLEAFFTYTGQLKITRRSRSGDVVDVVCTRWDEWNRDFKRERDASEKSSKRAQNTTTTRGRKSGGTTKLGATEVEVEVDDESDVEAVGKAAPIINLEDLKGYTEKLLKEAS